MSSRKLLPLGLLGAVTLTVSFSVTALAQPSGAPAQAYPAACPASAVTPKSSEDAHTVYSNGRLAYDEGNYESAISSFREAYRRDCSKHDLLIIISRAYELKGDKAEAVKALEIYLERVPSAPDASTHKAKIETLKKQIAAAPPPPPPTASATTTATAPPPEVREHTVAPWIVTGVGAAAVVTGAILLGTSASFPDNCSKQTNQCSQPPTGPTRNLDKDRDDAEKNQRRTPGVIVLAAGGAALVGGLLWHFLEPTGPVTASPSSNARARVSPDIGPGYAGVSLGGAF